MLKDLLKQVLRRRASNGAASAAGAAERSLASVRRLLQDGEPEAAAQALAALDGPPGAEALWLGGELARKQRGPAAAEPLYRQALQRDPRHRESWMSLGTLCYRDGRWAEAHQHFRAALALRPQDAEALNELGLVELAFGNFTDARSTFEELLDRHAGHAEGWNNLGLSQAAQGDPAEACRAFRRAVALKPGFLTAWTNLGLACRDRNRPEEARQAFERACALGAGSGAARTGLALALQDQGDLEAARTHLDQALAAEPDNVDALSALGALLTKLGAANEARGVLERALALAPDHAEAQLAMAHLLLAQGEYGEGWKRYEFRLQSRASPRRAYPLPHWEGERPPAGRRVLVYGEQGLGEQIMFASMLCDLTREAQAVAFDCEPRLKALFARSFAHLHVTQSGVTPGEPAERFDCCIAIGSLGRYYRRGASDFPPHQGYLRADAERRARWREKLDALGAGPKIGLAWRGGLASTGRVLRSLEAHELTRLAAAGEAVWVSLQHDARSEELAQLARFGEHAALLHDAGCLLDLDDTAALMGGLDLIIAPCSTVVHLAGALGRPVWVLTPFAPAWRYRMAGEGMPWYPSARLFRQPRPGAWEAVIDAVGASLAAFFPRSLRA